MDRDLIRLIVHWVAEHAQYESALLNTDPQCLVNARDFLHHLAMITNVSDEEMEEWVEEANAKKENT